LKQQLKLKLVVPNDINMIDEESVFLVCNMYTKTKLSEDALINVSIERTKAGKVMGAAIIRSRAKEFAQLLGDKIKNLLK
jgi:Coatomer beta subunit appendage platform